MAEALKDTAPNGERQSAEKESILMATDRCCSQSACGVKKELPILMFDQ
jgi:hypothetical protein